MELNFTSKIGFYFEKKKLNEFRRIISQPFLLDKFNKVTVSDLLHSLNYFDYSNNWQAVHNKGIQIEIVDSWSFISD